MNRPASATPPSPAHCGQCRLPLAKRGPDGAPSCPAGCTPARRGASISPDVMALVNQYWERRLLEGREKDWT